MKKFGLTSDQINATVLNQLGFSRSNYTTICNPDRETTFFVEVNMQELHRPQWMNLLILSPWKLYRKMRVNTMG